MSMMHSALTKLLLGSDGLPNVQAHRQRLQDRISQVECELMALRTCHNTFAAINALPAEVLSNILLLHAREIMEEYPTWHKKSIFWIHSTHVCGHWRKVALDCPGLWSKILFITPEVASTMLRRSKATPLVVETLLRGTAFVDVLSEVFSQPSRLHTLELSGVSAPAFLSTLTSSTPILKKLVLSGPPGIAIDLPAGFLHGCAPSLRHLEVQRLGAKMWKMLPLGPSLTYLELTAALPGNSNPSPKDFINALSRMPLLHTLRLTDILPRDEGYPQVTQPEYASISSPALRTLDLADSIGPVTAFLRVIDIPEQARVKIHINQTILETGRVEECLANFVASCVQKKQTDVKGLIVFEKYDNNGYGGILEVKYFFGCPPIHESDAPELNISFFNARLRTGEYLNALNQYIDISWLTFLMVEGEGIFLTSDVWLSAFSHLRNLETVTIRNRQVSHFLDALRDTSSQLPFPALSTIDLFEINFMTGFGLRRQSTVENLVDALAARTTVCPVGFLRIVECKHFKSADYTFIRDSLPDLFVEWDENLAGDQLNGMRLWLPSLP